jgi:putative transposase
VLDAGQEAKYSLKTMNGWHHSPVHIFPAAGAYMVTAGTYLKQHFFNTPERLDFLQNLLFELSDRFGWQLQAWALFSNHYHFVGISPEKPQSLKTMLNRLHSLSAREANRLDGNQSRKVWFQFWDTHLTYEKSYLARLNYVHQNPVHHNLVPVANLYQWCSASWFESNAKKSFIETVHRIKTDRIKVIDDFAPNRES